MKQIDTLIHARWIIPVEPANVVFEDHSLAIDDGRIVAILPAAEARQQYRGKNELTLEEQALIPGLINTHTHAAMSLFRGLADDMPLMEWLNDHIWPAEGKWASGFCPVHKLHQAGVNVAPGTDGAASNNDLDMFGEMRTAALLAKAVGQDASAIPAALPCKWRRLTVRVHWDWIKSLAHSLWERPLMWWPLISANWSPSRFTIPFRRSSTPPIVIK